MSGRDSLWDLSDLVLEAGVDADRWSDIPRLITSIWPGTKAVLLAHDNASRRNLGLLTHGFDAKVSLDYRDHYALINPWLPAALAAPVGVPLCADEMLPSDSFKDSEFYEWIEREGEVESAAGMKLFEDSRQHASMNIHYGTGLAEKYNAEIPLALKQVSSSFQSALLLNRLIGDQALPLSSLERVLDAIPAPAFVVDSKLRLRGANRTGCAELKLGRVVSTNAVDLIRFPSTDDGTQLSAAITTACQAPREGAAPSEVTLKPSKVGTAVLATVIPLSSAGLNSHALWLFNLDRLALVVLHGLDRQHVIDPQLLVSLFELTKTEARVAAGIAAGNELSAMAGQIGISRNTVQQHLKSVFLKSQTRRQTDLAILLTRLGLTR